MNLHHATYFVAAALLVANPLAAAESASSAAPLEVQSVVLRLVEEAEVPAMEAGLQRTTSPQPTIPSPRRTQAYASCSGSKLVSGPGSAIWTVRA